MKNKLVFSRSSLLVSIPVIATSALLCVLAAFPFAICGFFTYNGMTFERFLIAVIRSELLYPRHLGFKSDNLYAKLMEHTSMKEDLKLD